MPAYRKYRVDGAGKIIAAEWLEAVDDDSAMKALAESGDGEDYELWCRQRLVARRRGNRIVPPGQD